MTISVSRSHSALINDCQLCLTADTHVRGMMRGGLSVRTQRTVVGSQPMYGGGETNMYIQY